MKPFIHNLPDITAADLEQLPLARSETIPSTWYTHPAFDALDKQHLLANAWQCIGHLSQLEQPGAYIAATVAENPVVVMRGSDGVLRGFFNVCRHRGGPLVTDERGTCGIFQCKYHGWTYLLDGSLRGVPKFDRTELFDKKDYGLIPVPVETWEGLVVASVGEPRVPFAAVTGGIRERIHPVGLSAKRFARRVVYTVRCNWKVYVDNYLEGYHLPLVHPELCNLLDYRQYVTETHERYSLQFSPLAASDNLYGSGGGEAFYYFIFPNIMLNILPGRLQTNLVVPLDHRSCRVIFDYYYDDVTSPQALAMIENDFAYSDRVQQEDIGICEHVQRGLESRAYHRGRFSVDMENGVHHFQCLLKEAYRDIITG